MLAESRGLVIRDYRTFWMGHKGDIENRYTINKRRLPPDLIEEMRKSFKRASELLETGRMEASEEQIEKVKQAVKEEMNRTIELTTLEAVLKAMPVKGSPPQELYDEYRKEHRLERELTVQEKVAILEKQRDAIVEQTRFLVGEGEEAVMSDYGHGSPTDVLRGIPRKTKEDPQEVIDESNLAEYLRNGWTFVSQLASGKVVVKK
jgi:hypothetical protein